MILGLEETLEFILILGLAKMILEEEN